MNEEGEFDRMTCEFPPRPSLRKISQVVYNVEEGLPVHTDLYRFAAATGPVALAEMAWRVGSREGIFPSSPFSNKKEQLPTVLNIILQLSKAATEKIINSQFHHFFRAAHPSWKLPGNIRYLYQPLSRTRPVIYALVHCTKDGTAPTKTEYLSALHYMSEYIGDTPEGTDDDHALAIDTHRDAYSNFSMNPKDLAIRKRPRSASDRRYAGKESLKPAIRTFILRLTERLKKIPEADNDKHLDWSICYIGWTSQKKDTRRKQHERHTGSNWIKFLLEATMACLVAPNRYYMQYVELTPVLDPVDVAIAEHTLSILASSYSQYGGLNGTTAGLGGATTTAMNRGDETWYHGAQQNIKQMVYSDRVRDLRKEILMREFLADFSETHTEFQEFDLGKKTLTNCQKDFEEELKKYQDAFISWKNINVQRWEKELRGLERDEYRAKMHDLMDSVDELAELKSDGIVEDMEGVELN